MSVIRPTSAIENIRRRSAGDADLTAIIEYIAALEAGAEPVDDDPNIENMKEYILSKAREWHLDVGHAWPDRLVMKDLVDWNPKEKAAYPKAFDKLVAAGIFEKRPNGYFLTPAGRDVLY